MKELEQKYLDVLDKLDWDVTDYTDDGRVELEKYSPAGEDFLVLVEVEDFPAKVDEYAYDFDIDEHIEMWIEARRNGVSGVPSTRELVKDAEDIQDMLNELADALNEADYLRKEKVEITIEKVLRVSKIVEVTKSELEDLRNGVNPFLEEMAEEVMSGSEEWNYCVNDMEGREIVPWG